MAKDDYFVIVYQILSYLYRKLKRGEEMDAQMISHQSPMYTINQSYWAYILHHMSEEKYIEGILFMEADGMSHPYPIDCTRCRITPKGIEHLEENSMMQKAKALIKDVKAFL